MPKTLFLLFLALTILWRLVPPASSQEPMVVTLGSFTLTAVSHNNTLHVRADWDTQSEKDTAGFILRRGQNGTFTTISPIIPAIGDFSQGSIYTYTDTTAVSGQTYVYQLVEITTSSQENLLRELTFTFTFIPTATPIPLGSGNSGGNNTSQPIPTNTPPPTATSQPTVTRLAATAVPTNTPSPTPNTLLPTATSQPPATSQPFIVPSLPTAAPTTPPNSSDTPNFIIIAPTSVVEGLGVQPVQAAELSAETEASENPEATAVHPPINTDQPSPEQPVVIAQNNAAPAATPIIVGGRNPVPSSPQQTQPQPAEARLSTFYLWGGFLAAMILFSAAVLGSIILFTRKREP